MAILQTPQKLNNDIPGFPSTQPGAFRTIFKLLGIPLPTGGFALFHPANPNSVAIVRETDLEPVLVTHRQTNPIPEILTPQSQLPNPPPLSRLSTLPTIGNKLLNRQLPGGFGNGTNPYTWVPDQYPINTPYNGPDVPTIFSPPQQFNNGGNGGNL